MHSRTALLVASAAGLAALVGMVTAAAHFADSEGHFWLYEAVGCVLTLPMAISMWHGASSRYDWPTSWKTCLLFCLAGAGFTALCALFDSYVARAPAFSSLFTPLGTAFTLVALAGALRAWLIEMFDGNESSARSAQSDA